MNKPLPQIADADEKLVWTYGDSVRVVQLMSFAAAKREGALMLHAVEHYYKRLHDLDFEFYSFRYKVASDSVRVACTFLVDTSKKEIVHAAGFANRLVHANDLSYIRDWCRHSEYVTVMRTPDELMRGPILEGRPL